jgi:hypothetical protein
MAQTSIGQLLSFWRRDVGAKVYDNHQALLESPNVQAVLIAVPIVWILPQFSSMLFRAESTSWWKNLLQVVKEVRKRRQQVAVAENFRYREDILKRY